MQDAQLNVSLPIISLWLVTATLPMPGTPALPAGTVGVVADPDCPVAVEQVRMERTAKGIALVYAIRNNDKDRVSGIVLTAAGVDWTGSVEQIQLLPVDASIAAGATATLRSTFASAELSDAARIVFGVQAVRWKGRRPEWRGALKLSAPVALAARQ